MKMEEDRGLLPIQFSSQPVFCWVRGRYSPAFNGNISYFLVSVLSSLIATISFWFSKLVCVLKS